ncbi:hypothetical protein AB0E56_13005 [Microbacterium sp. NPDC028030]|uniref:hypothetical protein n=1 Tax=Microbacterium sp. NPDC028030 TaxID=3155124 RepID=UPI0033E5FEDF
MIGAELTFTEQITPYLPLLGTIVGGIVVGAFAMWNRRKGNTETKAPTVAEIWARADRLEFRARWAFRIQDAFREYVARVRGGGSVIPTLEEQAALDKNLETNSKESS